MPTSARSSLDFAEPLTVTIRRSPRLLWVLAGMHTLALVAAVLTPVALGWRLALIAVVLTSGVDTWRRYGQIGAAVAAVIVAVREHRGAFTVRRAHSEAFVPATLIGFTLLPFAVLLEFKIPPSRTRKRIAIVNDAVDAETFQHLRARLRLRGGRAPTVSEEL